MKHVYIIDGISMCFYIYMIRFVSSPHLRPIGDLNIHSFLIVVPTLLLKCDTKDKPSLIVTRRICCLF